MFGTSWWQQRYSRIQPPSPWLQDPGALRDSSDLDSGETTPTLEKLDCRFENKHALRWNKSLITHIAIGILVITSATLGSAVGYYYGSRHHHCHGGATNPVEHLELPAKGERTCGNSSSEALALGCTFNQMMWAWLPPGCPHYANNEFMAAENWTYYLDNQKGQVASGENWELALDNEVPLWGESREHTTHCVFVFLSLAQIIRDGTPYSWYFRNYGHMAHCVGVLLEVLKQEPERDRISTFVGQVSYEQYCY